MVRRITDEEFKRASAEVLERHGPLFAALAAGDRAEGPLKLLFVCSACTDRSPTAARVFAGKGYDTMARGTWPSARRRLRLEDLEWADLALVMEEEHAAAIREAFPALWSGIAGKVEVLGVPDEYGRDDPQLVAALEDRVGRALGRALRPGGRLDRQRAAPPRGRGPRE